MTSITRVNNVLTYRRQRLRGVPMLRGWVSFVLACSVGGCETLWWRRPRVAWVKMVPRRNRWDCRRGVWEYAVTMT